MRKPFTPALASALIMALCVSKSAAQLPDGAALNFSVNPTASSLSLSLTDSGNHAYRLESSTDLVFWNNLGAWKIFNGSSSKTFAITPQSVPKLFYRAVYDSAVSGSNGNVAEALKLPATIANYANPSLSARFLVQPIVGQDNTPASNPVTNAGATLGRVLFYDKRLSLNQTISCASCHQAEHGFSDPRKFSVGFNGGLTTRNSMGLTNARWYLRGSFFWDERAATLEEQVLHPIQNPIEMGMTLPALVTRISAEPFYATLFNNAFGSTTVTSDKISKALAQFVRSIVSTHSKYDTGQPINFSNFTAQENLGRQIFGGQVGGATCTNCHGSDNFVPGPNINNNGLENPYVDKGVGSVTGRTQDEGLFKAPTLRNIELTAPYMHDGRFTTLEEVVEFYNSGVVNHPNLSPPLRTPGGPLRLNLTTAQKAALVAFLKTLTEKSALTDEKFSDPFNYGN